MVTKNKYSKQIRLSLLLITACVTFILFNREKKGKNNK